MPGKHVTFAPEIRVFPLLAPSSPAPSTPLSSYSLPTSDEDGPSTPPPPLSLDPYSYSPQRLVPTLGGASINPRLSPSTSKYGNSPIIGADLTYDISQSTAARQMPSGSLFESATYPPLPYMLIVHKRLPWQIKLVPSDPSLGYVTVRDVLSGIPAFLRQSATKAEYDLIPGEQAKSDVSGAYMRRCKDALNFEAERRAGLKRVDFLRSRTRFAGLTGTSQGPQVWEVHTTT